MSLDIRSDADREPDAVTLTDPRVLRALAHPLRVALVELLWQEGSVNATQAAAALGVSQASCSYHLRALAKFGLVAEVEGVRGRARPWRLTKTGFRFSNVQEDPQAAAAWGALEKLLRERQIGRYRRWLEQRASFPREWQEAAYHGRRVAWLTAEELDQVSEPLTALLSGLFQGRHDDPASRPAGAVAVEFLSLAYPIIEDTQPPG